MNKIEYLPQLRFKDFKDTWEDKKLGECFKERNERSSNGELISVTISSGVKKASELERHDNSSEDKSNYKCVYEGDIAYNSMRMWQGASGYSPYRGILSPAYTVCIPEDNMDSKFFAYMFKKNEMIHSFEINSQGLTKDTWNLKFPAFSLIHVLCPKSKEEQQKIGYFFSKIDDNITLHQKKLDKLKKIKAAYLTQLFPQNESLKPKLRFEGFTDEWKKSTIGEISIIKTGGTPSSVIPEYWFPKEIVWLSSGEVNKKYIFSSDDMISNLGFENSSATWIKKHSVLIALAGQGKTRGTVAVNEIPVTTNQSIAGIELKKEYDYLFLLFFLEGKYDALRQASSGDGTRGGLNKQILNDFKILIPTYKEQIMIGNFFRKLDNQIFNYQKEIDKLKKLKSAYLKEMFV